MSRTREKTVNFLSIYRGYGILHTRIIDVIILNTT
jgi:hypothetical protein